MTLTTSQKRYIQALLSLMDEKPYHDITISELAERADYNRRTYYRHFNTLDDVLLLHCSCILNGMVDLMKEMGTLTPKSGFLSYFTFWNQHADFLQMLNRHQLIDFLGKEQNKLMYQIVGLSVTNNLPDYLSETSIFSQYSYYFCLGGLWSVIDFWVQSGMKQSPEQLTNYVLDTFSQMGKLL